MRGRVELSGNKRLLDYSSHTESTDLTDVVTLTVLIDSGSRKVRATTVTETPTNLPYGNTLATP
jgi:hypothetical protein